jgi:hypothetical protein
MEFLKALAALTAVFYATAIIGCLGSDLCYDLGTEAWWATIGRMAVYSPLAWISTEPKLPNARQRPYLFRSPL